MRRDTLHMTLAFIGAVSPEQLGVLREIAGRIRGEPFDLKLDRLGCWPHNRIAWAGCSDVPPRLRRLVNDLATGLAEAGFVLDKRSFMSHVTLARNACCDNLPELTEPIHWRISDFVIVESLLQPSGARYHLLDRWPLSWAADKKISKGC